MSEWAFHYTVAPTLGATLTAATSDGAATEYSSLTQALPLTVYSILLHHSLTCCCHSVHVRTLPLVVQALILFKHYSLSSLSEACFLSFSLWQAT